MTADDALQTHHQIRELPKIGEREIHEVKLRSSKIDPRRQPHRPTPRRGGALRNKIIAGLLFAVVAIFLALVISALFK